MSKGEASQTLMRAESRLQAAVARIEAAVRKSRTTPGGQLRAERDAYARDCELLRAECDGLRRELSGVIERHAKLENASREVERRLDRVIGELGEMSDE